MKKFLVLYRSSMPASEMMANATPEQAKAGMEAWMAWAQRVGDALVDMGAPLGTGKGVGDGSASASDSTVSGYSVLQAESEDAAVALVQEHPHLATPGDAAIDVHELLSPPGM